MERPKLLVSGCLLGEKVRYNGEAKENRWMTNSLAEQVEFIPICPEVTMGLGIPREAVRLVRGEAGEIGFFTSRSQQDLTELAHRTALRLISALPSDLDGAILTSKSPSCGPDRVKVYEKSGNFSWMGSGLFAARLREAHPHLPIIGSGRLSDPIQRRHFQIRVFTLHAFRLTPRTVRDLQHFHRRNKFLIMAHSPAHVSRLGQIAASCSRQTLDVSFEKYRETLAHALTNQQTPGRLRNALTHVYGFLKARLEPEKRRVLLGEMAKLDQDYLPSLSTTVTLLKYENLTQRVSYIEEQTLITGGGCL